MKAALLVVVATTVATATLLAPSLGLGGGDGRKVLEARVLGAVVPPYTGPTNPIRGVPGAGAPWVIGDSEVDLRSDGRLKLEVTGLVLTSNGTNPIQNFNAVVSCQTTVNGAAAVSNVRTESFPANTAGNAEFKGEVDLPSPCFAPIVFVAIPGANGAADRWLAVTGR
ncbi:MAG TPA: hypothetical protein VH305_06525 [Gaiella sp.]|jgi:hypothetical protein